MVRSPAIRALIAALIMFDGELAPAALSAERDVFTSVEPPPGISARWFAELCRSGAVAGALKVGRRWQCSRAAWFARAHTVKRVEATDERELAARDLEIAGVKLRLVGGRR